MERQLGSGGSGTMERRTALSAASVGLAPLQCIIGSAQLSEVPYGGIDVSRAT